MPPRKPKLNIPTPTRTGMATRASNKDYHVPNALVPKPRRSPQEVAEEKAAMAKELEETQAHRNAGISKAAALEAQMLREDEDFEANANHPPIIETPRQVPAKQPRVLPKPRPRRIPSYDEDPFTDDEGGSKKEAGPAPHSDSSDNEKPAIGVKFGVKQPLLTGPNKEKYLKKGKERAIRASIENARGRSQERDVTRKRKGASPDTAVAAKRAKVYTAEESEAIDKAWRIAIRERAEGQKARKAAVQQDKDLSTIGATDESTAAAATIEEDTADDNAVHMASFLDDEEEDARLLEELQRRRQARREFLEAQGVADAADAADAAQLLRTLQENEAAVGPSDVDESEPGSITVSVDPAVTKPVFKAGRGFSLARKHNQITTIVKHDDAVNDKQKAHISTAVGVATTSTLKLSTHATTVAAGGQLGEAIVAPISTAAQAVPQPAKPEKSKWKTGDVPEKMRAVFSSKLVPWARILAGSLPPWAALPIEQMQPLFTKAFPTIPYIMTTHDVYYSLIMYRISDLRNKIGSVAVTGVESIFGSSNNEDGQQEYDILDGETRREQIREHVAFLLGDSGKKAVPFHWGDWGNGIKKTGTFQGELILYTFANAYLGQYKALGPQDPFLAEHEDPPIGAVIMSIQAVERALSFFKTGEKKIPTGSSSYFSVDNWGDHSIIVDGKAKKVKRATQYVKTLKGWKKEKWDEYIKAAWEHYEEPNRKRAGVVVIDDDEEEDSNASDDDFVYESDAGEA